MARQKAVSAAIAAEAPMARRSRGLASGIVIPFPLFCGQAAKFLHDSAVNTARSGILDHIERFGGGAPGEVERFFGCSAQRIFPPAQPAGAGAANRTSGFLQSRAAVAEIPEKARCDRAELCEGRLLIHCFSG